MDIGLLANIAQIRAVLNNTFKPPSVQNFLRIKAQNWGSPNNFVWKRNLDPNKIYKEGWNQTR
jgi:hypothetical protein